MTIKDINEILGAADRFVETPVAEVPKTVSSIMEGKRGRKISGEDFETLRPFLRMHIESKRTVGGVEIKIDKGRMEAEIIEFNSKTGEILSAWVIIPPDEEPGFMQAFYDAVMYIKDTYKRIPKAELYKEPGK